MTETRDGSDTYRHGSRPVTVPAVPVGPWVPARSRSQDAVLRAAVDGDPPNDVPARVDDLLRAARAPLRPYATVPVVGLEGGVGRTTVTQLLCRAFADIRSAPVAAVDAVSMWGGLSTSLPPRGSEWSVRDIARASWPPEDADDFRRVAFAADGHVHTLRSRPVGQPGWPNAADAIAAVRRVNALFDMTVVDTAADPFGEVALRLILAPHTTPLWVCSGTRSGLWGVHEAIAHIDRECDAQLSKRSVIVATGPRRRWPAPAAAAEAQLGGRQVPTVRVSLAETRVGVKRAGINVLAATVSRSS